MDRYVEIFGPRQDLSQSLADWPLHRARPLLARERTQKPGVKILIVFDPVEAHAEDFLGTSAPEFGVHGDDPADTFFYRNARPWALQRKSHEYDPAFRLAVMSGGGMTTKRTSWEGIYASGCQPAAKLVLMAGKWEDRSEGELFLIVFLSFFDYFGKRFG